MRAALVLTVLVASAVVLLPWSVASAAIIEVNADLSDMMVDPSRPLLYVSSASGSAILAVDTTTEHIDHTILVGSIPGKMDISPDGNTLYVTLTGGNSVAVVDLETQQFDGTITLSGSPATLALCGTNRLYASAGLQIEIVDTVTRSVVGILPNGMHLSRAVLVCNRPEGVLLTRETSLDTFIVPGGDRAFIVASAFPQIDAWDVNGAMPILANSSIFSFAGFFEGSLPAINTIALTRVGGLILEWNPAAVAVSPDGATAYAAHGEFIVNPVYPTTERHDPREPDVHVYDAMTFAERARLPVSAPVAGGRLAVSSDGAKLFAVVGTGSNQDIEVFALAAPTGFPVVGTVTSKDGEPVEAATVTLTSKTGGEPLMASSDANGRFEIMGVVEGSYVLRVVAQGFLSVERPSVVVSGGPPVVRPIRLSAPPANPSASFVRLGEFLFQLAADPTRPLVYVANASRSSILVVNTNTAELVAEIPVGSAPHTMDVSSDGGHLYVALSGGSEVAVVDLDSQELEGTISLDHAAGRLSLCGTDGLYVGIGVETQVIDTVTRLVVGSLPSLEVIGCNRPNATLLTFERRNSAPRVDAWDVSGAVPTVSMSGTYFGGGCGIDPPYQAEFSPDGARGYIVADRCSIMNDGLLPVFETASFVKVGTLILEWQPNAVALAPDGATAYASHGDSVTNPTSPPEDRHDRSIPDVHVFNTAFFFEESRVALDGPPGVEGLAVSGDGQTLVAIVGTAPNQDVQLVAVPEAAAPMARLPALVVVALLARGGSGAYRKRSRGAATWSRKRVGGD